MITPDYVRLMAQYNRWQNASVFGAAGSLSDAARRQDRGAFFRSIHETLAHILAADELWLSRFGACASPDRSLAQSAARYEGWDALATARGRMDDIISDWAAAVGPGDLSGELSWYSGMMERQMKRPLGLLIAHVFNHQTHHRGQVHAMLTAAGAKPQDTDIPFMPGLEG